MKIIILFLALLSYQNGFSQKVLSHSDYSKNKGEACVIYNEILYSVKWFPNKKWLTSQTEECNIKGQKKEVQISEKDSLNFEKEIFEQIINPKKANRIPPPPPIKKMKK